MKEKWCDVEVSGKEEWQKYLDWYKSNFGECTGEMVMVADRYNVKNQYNQVVAYITTYIEEEYFIRIYK